MPEKEYPIITGPSKEEVMQSLRSSEPFYEPGNPQGIEDYDTSYPAIFTTASENDPHTARPISVEPERIDEIAHGLLSIEGTAKLIPEDEDQAPEDLGHVYISYDRVACKGLLTAHINKEPKEY